MMLYGVVIIMAVDHHLYLIDAQIGWGCFQKILNRITDFSDPIFIDDLKNL